MTAKIFKCNSCGFEFSAVVTDVQISARAVPCLGCGSHDLEVVGETAMSLNYSREAENSIHCTCHNHDEK